MENRLRVHLLRANEKKEDVSRHNYFSNLMHEHKPSWHVYEIPSNHREKRKEIIKNGANTHHMISAIANFHTIFTQFHSNIIIKK